jgi:hypothetical protein
MGPRKYVRSGPLGPNLDIKTYDSGTLFVATVDGASGSPPWGKLWVEYDVTFSVPQVTNTGLNSYIHLTSTTPTSSSLIPLPTVVAGTMPLSVVGSTLTFPAAGTYFVNYQVFGSTSVTQVATPAPSGGASLVTSYGEFSDGYEEAGSGTTSMIQNVMIQTTLPNQSLVFDNTITGGVQSQLVVFLLPSGAI